MDARPARVMSVTRIQRALNAAGNLNLRTVYEEPPPRGVLSFAYFSLDAQRKVCFKTQKKFLRSIEGTSRSLLNQLHAHKFCQLLGGQNHARD